MKSYSEFYITQTHILNPDFQYQEAILESREVDRGRYKWIVVMYYDLRQRKVLLHWSQVFALENPSEDLCEVTSHPKEVTKRDDDNADATCQNVTPLCDPEQFVIVATREKILMRRKMAMIESLRETAV